MAGVILKLLLLGIQAFALDCTGHVFRRVYKPYGIRMCRELCKVSTETFIYIEEDLTCHRVPNDLAISDRMRSARIQCISRTGLDVCNNEDGERTIMIPVQSQSGSKLESSMSECYGNTSEIRPTLTTEALLTTDVKIVQNKYSSCFRLEKACTEGKLDQVQNILSKGLEDINCRFKVGTTPVLRAAQNGYSHVFHYLVDQGCDLSAVSNHNNVLHYACIGGSLDIVKTLVIRKDFDIERRGTHGRSAIMWAACYGRKKVFDYLVSMGCNLTGVDEDMNNILHLAYINRHQDIVLKYVRSMRVFKKMSRKTNKNGFTPIETRRNQVKGHAKRQKRGFGHKRNHRKYRKNRAKRFFVD